MRNIVALLCLVGALFVAAAEPVPGSPEWAGYAQAVSAMCLAFIFFALIRCED